MNIYGILATLGLGYSHHDIPDTIEFDLIDLPDFEDLMFPEPDTDYLYRVDDIVTDGKRKGKIVRANVNPYPGDDQNYYYVAGMDGKWADYLLADDICYAVGR